MKILTIIGTYFFVLGALLLLLIICFFVFTKIRKKRLMCLLERVAQNKHFNLEFTSGIYDYRLVNNDLVILIKVLYVPRNSAITVNSRDTWCLRYGGTNKYHYSRQCYLKSMIPFLQHKALSNERKVVLVYPDTNKIQRYLNESEIAIVNYGELVYDYKIITFSNFEKHFEDLH